MKTLFVYAGLIVYLLNYSIGWLLYFGRLRIGKREHQIVFALIFILLLILIPYHLSEAPKLMMLFASLLMMILLPFGKKGGIYHRVVSTLGFMFYLSIFFI